MGGGQITIGDSGEAHYVEAHPSDGYDENGKPLVVSLEEDRLWVVARGQRVDVTDQVDEKTPYVDTWWDGEGNLYYVIVGGTPEDYGWYEGVTVPDGSGGGSGILSSRTDISPGEQNDVEWFTQGCEQVRGGMPGGKKTKNKSQPGGGGRTSRRPFCLMGQTDQGRRTLRRTLRHFKQDLRPVYLKSPWKHGTLTWNRTSDGPGSGLTDNRRML